jgi:hypothetical protein
VARARNPALDRADCTVADLRGFLVAEAAGADEHHDFAMVLAERPEGALEVAELERRFLGGGNRAFRDRRLVERRKCSNGASFCYCRGWG